MPFPLSSIALLSLEVTRALVVLGYGLNFDTDAATAGAPRFTALSTYSRLAITACTGSGVFPIVITTAHPHGVSGRASACGGLSCVISSVTGNTAANNLDADPTSRTHGLPAGVLAIPLSTTTLALYGQDPVEGNLVPLVGNGAYTGGGTVTPALTDGSILIGRPTTREFSAAPRICFVPRSIASTPRRVSSPNPTRRNGERRAEIQQRSIGTDVHAFDVHAWGEANPPDAAGDYILADALRECVRSALHDLACGTSEEGAGVWDDEKERAAQLIKSGHLLTFGATISVPVTDNPILGGLPFVPVGTTFSTTVQSPTPEIAATFTGPTITPG